MEAIGEALARDGWSLRSGGAPGADAAFERGCDRAGGTKQGSLPWSGYCGHVSPLHEVTPARLDLATRYHPHWRKLSHKARLLIARNGTQILGPDLTSPVALIVCWTEGGMPRGGTAQALRIAGDPNRHIPVLNLGEPTLECLKVGAVIELIDCIDSRLLETNSANGNDHPPKPIPRR